MFLQALWLKNSQIVKLFKGINYISVLEAADRKAVVLIVVVPADRGEVRVQAPEPRGRTRVLTGGPEVAVRAAVEESAIRGPVAGQISFKAGGAARFKLGTAIRASPASVCAANGS